MKKLLLLLILLPLLSFSQIDADKMVTFSDMKWLIDNEGFVEREDFSDMYNSTECITKSEAIYYIKIIDDNLSGIGSNQLVPRRLLDPAITDYYNLLNAATPQPNEVDGVDGTTIKNPETGYAAIESIASEVWHQNIDGDYCIRFIHSTDPTAPHNFYIDVTLPHNGAKFDLIFTYTQNSNHETIIVGLHGSTTPDVNIHIDDSEYYTFKEITIPIEMNQLETNFQIEIYAGWQVYIDNIRMLSK